MANRLPFLTLPVKPLALLLAGAVLFAASSARAEPSPASTQTGRAPTGSGLASPEPQELVPRTRPTERKFYGWEILLTGEVAGLVTAAAVEVPVSRFTTPASTLFFLLGMPAYALSGPVSHWSHDDFTKGLVSFGANVVGVAVAGVIGGKLSCGHAGAPDGCGATGFFHGLSVAVVTVPLLDAFILGWENVPISDEASVPRERGTPSIVATPIVGVTPQGVTLGLSGRF